MCASTLQLMLWLKTLSACLWTNFAFMLASSVCHYIPYAMSTVRLSWPHPFRYGMFLTAAVGKKAFVPVVCKSFGSLLMLVVIAYASPL